jgi:hypothetical protein
MTDDPGFRTGGTVGGRCGCAAGALFVLLMPIVALGLFMGDCFDLEPCNPNGGWRFPATLAALAALGTLLGLCIRALVNWWTVRRHPEGAGRPPLLAIAGLIALAGLALWLGGALGYLPY